MITMRAAAAAAAVVALVSAAPASADPDAVDGPVPPSTAVTPGAGFGAYDANGDRAGACTLGFLATGPDGTRYAFTAGHCSSTGNAVLPYRTPDDFRRVGRFVHTVDEPAADIAAIALTDALPHDARVLSRRPVTGVTADVSTDDTLCFYGMRTGGHPHCGRVTAPPIAAEGDYNFTFAVAAVHGDSGSPVYRIERSGSATAVGILDSTAADGTSTATLIEPFLSRWNLSLTCQTGPTTETCHA